MTVTIKYDSQFADYTLTSYTHEWAEKHGDITEVARTARKYGQFEGGSAFEGTKYILPSSHNGGTGMVVEGDLKYSFMPQHTFFGKMESLELGEGIINNPDGVGQQLSEVQLKLSGLDITGEFDPAKQMSENHEGEMHKATYGLMRGNADPLLEILKAKGIETTTPLKDMAIASQFTDTMADAPIVDTVGVYEDSEGMLMAA
ncbi:heme acquisition protein HasA [Yersinia aleksiciae]|uniref:Hemophore HasA n=1 Tax=Yersinia aleksiciae TaxID=263819 RepID=A0A0T9UYP5_YERAE|nr:heme acquisition protein HasA [Yersinia aleksiciae]AKP33815.1 heme acquisition hemophore HasA [Yersinia aleksiciae]CFQ46291.1 hemophore HasA [Yersinia aleksiciae]CNL85088.1 hemophore HasA [Yersinia aleksiciae]